MNARLYHPHTPELVVWERFSPPSAWHPPAESARLGRVTGSGTTPSLPVAGESVGLAQGAWMRDPQCVATHTGRPLQPRTRVFSAQLGSGGSLFRGETATKLERAERRRVCVSKGGMAGWLMTDLGGFLVWGADRPSS
jgi:hypothetical protein